MTASIRVRQRLPATRRRGLRAGSAQLLVAAGLVAWLLVGCSGSVATGDTEPTSAQADASNTTGQAATTSAASGPAVDATGSDAATDPAAQAHPDVVGVVVTPTDDTWTIAATIASPYDTPQRYADAFRVLAPDGTVLGVRELAHDHAAEQPFTRSLSDVEIPADATTVTVEGRDLANGWGGATLTVDVPR